MQGYKVRQSYFGVKWRHTGQFLFANDNDDKWSGHLGPRESTSLGVGPQIGFCQYHVPNLFSQDMLTEITVTVTKCGN